MAVVHLHVHYIIMYMYMYIIYNNSYVLNRLAGDGLGSIPHYDQWKPRRKIYDHSFNKG